MVVIEIGYYDENTLGSLHLYENNENGEIEIKDVKGNISIQNMGVDDIMYTNDLKIRVQIAHYNLEEAIKDYVNLKEWIGTYNYIAENDILYWYDCAKEDEYDITLLNLCEKYEIEMDYHELEQDDNQEAIYKMEEMLKDILEPLIFGHRLEASE